MDVHSFACLHVCSLVCSFVRSFVRTDGNYPLCSIGHRLLRVRCPKADCSCLSITILHPSVGPTVSCHELAVLIILMVRFPVRENYCRHRELIHERFYFFTYGLIWSAHFNHCIGQAFPVAASLAAGSRSLVFCYAFSEKQADVYISVGSDLV